MKLNICFPYNKTWKVAKSKISTFLKNVRWNNIFFVVIGNSKKKMVTESAKLSEIRPAKASYFEKHDPVGPMQTKQTARLFDYIATFGPW